MMTRWFPKWSWRGWRRRFVTVFLSGLPINVIIGWLLEAGVSYLVAAPVVVLVVCAGLTTVLTVQEGGSWRGWPRRFVVVLAPSIPINFAIGGLLAVGVPYWISMSAVAVTASAIVATVLTAQEEE